MRKKRTAQKDTIIDITSDSQVNSNFPYRWSPASLTFNNYFYHFFYFYITRITLNNNTPHLKSQKNQKQKSRLGTAVTAKPYHTNVKSQSARWEGETRQDRITKTRIVIVYYSRLSLSRSRRDPLKHFEISVLRHIRCAELRKIPIEQPNYTKEHVI